MGEDFIRAVAWSPDGTYLAVAGSGANTNDSDTAINPDHALRIYRYNNQTKKLVGVTSSAYGITASSMYSLAWLKKDNELYLAVGGSGDETKQHATKQELKIYHLDTNKHELVEYSSRNWASNNGIITCLSWHPHKSYLAVGGYLPNTNDNDAAIDKNNALRIYTFDPKKPKAHDRLNGITSKPWSNEQKPINSIAWNYHGTMLAVAGTDPNANAVRDDAIQNSHEIRIYSFDQEKSGELSGLTSTGWSSKTAHAANSLAWSPDDEYLAVGGKCTEILASAHKGQSLHECRIYRITPDAQKREDRITQIASKGWSAKGGEIFSVSWNNDGTHLAVAGNNPDIRDEDIRLNQHDELRVYHFNPQHHEYQERLIGICSKPWSSKQFGIYTTAWHPTDNLLIIGGKRPDEAGSDKKTIQASASLRLYELTDAPAGDPISLKRHNKSTEQPTKILTGITSTLWVKLGAAINKTAWSNSGKYLALGGKMAHTSDSTKIIAANHDLRLYEFTSSGLLPLAGKAWSDSGKGVYALGWSPDDKYLAVGGELADAPAKTGKPQAANNIHIYRVNSAAVKPDDRLTLVTSLYIGQSESVINDIAWNPDGKSLVIVGSFTKPPKPDAPLSSSGGEIKLYNFNQETCQLSLASEASVGSKAFKVTWARNKKNIAVASAYGLVIYKISQQSLTQVSRIDAPKAPETIYSVSWSPDSSYLIVGGSGGKEGSDLFVYQFDAAKGLLSVVAQAKWARGSEAIYDVSWNNDGEFIAVGGVNSDNIEKAHAADKSSYALGIFKFNASSSTLTQVHQKPWADLGGKIMSVTWSPNGEYLSIAGMQPNQQGEDMNINNQHEFRLFRLKKTNANFFAGAASKEWSSETDPIIALAWNHDGKLLAVGGIKPNQRSKDETITESDPLRIYEFDEKKSTLKAVATISLGSQKDILSEISTLAWNPHENTLAFSEQKLSNKQPISSTLHIYKFDTKTKTPELITSKLFSNKLNGSINAIEWSPDGSIIACGGKNPSGSEPNITEKDVLRLYQLNNTTKKLTGVIGKQYGTEASIKTLSWLEDQEQTFLAIGGTNMEQTEPTPHQKNISSTTSGTALSPISSSEKSSLIKVYELKNQQLTQIWQRQWSTTNAPINTLAWSPNKLFLAAGGGTSNTSDTGIPTNQALQIYFFDSGSKTFSGITSRGWSNDDGVINTISWSPNNLFLAIGGQRPNLSNKDKNIHQCNEFRLYFFDAFKLAGLTSCDWSTLGYPLNSIAWDHSGKFIVLGGQKPTTFNSAPNSNALQLYRFSGGDALPLSLKDALQKTPASTSLVLSRSNGEYWSVDRGSIFYFDGIGWESARIDGSLKNPNHTFITEGEKNSIFALDNKGKVHRAINVSTGPALIVWQALPDVGTKVSLASIFGASDILFGIGDDKKYYQYSETSGWKKLANVPEQAQKLIKQQKIILNYVCAGSTARKKGILEGYAL